MPSGAGYNAYPAIMKMAIFFDYALEKVAINYASTSE